MILYDEIDTLHHFENEFCFVERYDKLRNFRSSDSLEVLLVHFSLNFYFDDIDAWTFVA